MIFPKVSLLLVVRNEKEYIYACLNSYLKQDYPHKLLEVIVVDGYSDDGTQDIIQSFSKKFKEEDIPFLFLDNPGKILSTGWNIALQNATGEFVCRIDGHCVIVQNYVSQCLDIYNKTVADCVGGLIDTVSATQVGTAIALAQCSLFGVGNAMFRLNDAIGRYVDTVAFGMYKREIFHKLGGLDEELVRNQDDEFNFRLIQRGGKIWLDPSIKTKYYPRSSLKKLFKQYFQYGYYKVRVIQKRRGFASWRHLVPGTFVAGLFFSISLGIAFENGYLLGLVAIPYIVTNILGSGMGGFSLAKPEKVKLYGIERDIVVSKNSRGYERIVTMEIGHEKIPFEDSMFSAVLARDILEHIERPWLVVDELYRVMQKGGIIICSVPKPDPKIVWSDYTHIRGFTSSAIRSLVENSGFEVLDLFLMSGYTVAAKLGISRYLPIIGKIPIIRNLFDSYHCIARK